MEINIFDLIIPLSIFFFGIIIGLVVGKIDKDQIMVKTYVKKPDTIDAIYFNGYNYDEVYNWIYDENTSESCEGYKETISIIIDHGMIMLNAGEYIIKYPDSYDFYKMSAEEFEDTYIVYNKNQIMEINLVALIITLASFIFGFILGVAVGKFDNNDNWRAQFK